MAQSMTVDGTRRRFVAGAGAAAAGAAAGRPAQPGLARAAANPATPQADIILKNGKIITVDPAFTITQAIAIAGDRIIAVGPDAAMARSEEHTSELQSL